jgi:hypothetical protein
MGLPVPEPGGVLDSDVLYSFPVALTVLFVGRLCNPA